MNATNETKKIEATEKKAYPIKSFVEYAEKSGIAAKVSTALAGGVYPITFASNGTGIVTSSIYTLSASKYGEKIPNEKFISVLAEVEKDGFSSPSGKKLLSILPKGYGNYKTLRARLLGDIKKGIIISFSPKEGAEGDYNKLRAIFSAK